MPAWPLALLLKTWPTAAHMSPSGRTGTEVGEGMEGERVQLGDRGLLGGAQLAARVLTAVKQESMSV